MKGDINMTDHKKFKNESQDARRHDKHDVTHPNEKYSNQRDKLDQNQAKDSHSQPNKRK